MVSLSMLASFICSVFVCSTYLLQRNGISEWQKIHLISFFPPAWSCVCSNFQRGKYPELYNETFNQRTIVIQHIIWADIHLSYFCKEHLALLWNIKEVWKWRAKDWKMFWILYVDLWKESRWQPITLPFLQTLGMAKKTSWPGSFFT